MSNELRSIMVYYSQYFGVNNTKLPSDTELDRT